MNIIRKFEQEENNITEVSSMSGFKEEGGVAEMLLIWLIIDTWGQHGLKCICVKLKVIIRIEKGIGI